MDDFVDGVGLDGVAVVWVLLLGRHGFGFSLLQQQAGEPDDAGGVGDDQVAAHGWCRCTSSPLDSVTPEGGALTYAHLLPQSDELAAERVAAVLAVG